GSIRRTDSSGVQRHSDKLGREDCTVQAPNSPPRIEAFVYAGVRPRVWAYNLLLQGYPGYKGYAFSSSGVRRTQTDGELGVTVASRLGRPRRFGAELTWEFVGRKSPEFVGPKARTHTWGGGFITVSHDFSLPAH